MIYNPFEFAMLYCPRAGFPGSPQDQKRHQTRHGARNHWNSQPGTKVMIFYIIYLLSIIILVLHFTGFLARRNMEWAVLLAAVALFAVNILDYLRII